MLGLLLVKLLNFFLEQTNFVVRAVEVIVYLFHREKLVKLILEGFNIS